MSNKSDNTAWFASVSAAFAAVYGPENAVTRQATLIPNILTDFKTMLVKSLPGQLVSEDYVIDDKRLILTLKGRKTVTGSKTTLIITRTQINGRDTKAVFTYL